MSTSEHQVVPHQDASSAGAVDTVASDGLGLFAPELACPCCGGSGLTIFHEQRDLPVHSVQLVTSYEMARSFPRGDLCLGLCRACGFITNAVYDDALQDYASSYEDSQEFSPRFREFSRELAARWIERYDLGGKTVLEIGSGKGAFLVDLCELGVGRAVGVDPAYVEGRLTSQATDRITFISEFYSEDHADLVGDAIVCRHTLEHIAPTAEFVRLVKRSLRDRTGVVLLFELPDMTRVLRDVAFWDVYYEHCSYFTPGSLARLFRREGFDVLDLALAYDNQYILIECRPAQATPTGPLALEETPAEVADGVRGFRSGFAEMSDRWRGELAARRADGQRIVIWGAGSKGVSFLTTLGVGDEVQYAVDINPYKQGKFMAGTGHEVVAPEFLRSLRPALVVAMNPVYLGEIGDRLTSLGVSAELIGA